MVDLCCMCGDVGFIEKLFRCNECRNRFQHSYCSNYYREFAEPIELCDWCQVERKKISKQTGAGTSKKSCETAINKNNRSEYSGNKIKQHVGDQETKANTEKEKGKTSVPSPRQITRRYKLLKDVMC